MPVIGRLTSSHVPAVDIELALELEPLLAELLLELERLLELELALLELLELLPVPTLEDELLLELEVPTLLLELELTLELLDEPAVAALASGVAASLLAHPDTTTRRPATNAAKIPLVRQNANTRMTGPVSSIAMVEAHIDLWVRAYARNHPRKPNVLTKGWAI